MAEQELHINQATHLLSPALTAAQKQLEAFAQTQSELASKATEINRFWVDRGQSEARLASELTSKLAAAHSIPDAMIAWQEWSLHRLERMAEDGKHLAADIQEVIKAGTRLLPNGNTRTSGSGLTSQ
jgi:phasin protein